MKYEQTYRDRVFGLILSFEGIFDINERVKPENRDEFISVVKEFIKYDLSNGFIVDLNSSYTKMQKINK